ncbi:MAG: MBL fold metallo-hydrolase [Panacagrimonas sp.]
MQIKVLGCSGGVGPGLRTTSLLLGDETLIDAGTGVGDLGLEEMRRIRQVFLTHAHLDHTCGLAFLADNLSGEVPGPILVRALSETLATLRKHLFNWELWPDFSMLPTADAPLLAFRDLQVGSTQKLGDGTCIRAFEVRHTIPAVGYLIESGAGAFAFTGDTGANPAMWEFFNGLPRLDRLMIDIAFPDEQAELGVVARHYTPELLGQELGRLRHRPELLLTHHKPGTEDVLKSQCASALSGWSYRHLRRGDRIDV